MKMLIESIGYVIFIIIAHYIQIVTYSLFFNVFVSDFEIIFRSAISEGSSSWCQ